MLESKLNQNNFFDPATVSCIKVVGSDVGTGHFWLILIKDQNELLEILYFLNKNII